MTYAPDCIDKKLARGNSRSYLGLIRGPHIGSTDPEPVDLTDKTMIFEMKRRPERRRLSPTDDVVVHKTSDNANEIEILNQLVEITKGRYRLKLVSADTEFLAPGVYAYSIDVLTATGGRFTVTEGRFILTGPATAAENLTPPC